VSGASITCNIRNLRAELCARYPGPVFAVLDSDHSKAHVLQELRILARLTSRGDRVVVEDRFCAAGARAGRAFC
jgi:cephalosporin hydroxylase